MQVIIIFDIQLEIKKQFHTEGEVASVPLRQCIACRRTHERLVKEHVVGIEGETSRAPQFFCQTG